MAKRPAVKQRNTDGPNPRQPCPCGSGKRYKACHGSSSGPVELPVARPLEGKKAASGERKSGTTIRVWPDPRYFDSVELPRADLVHLLRSKAVLMPGVKVSLTVEKGGKAEPERQDWLYKAGLSDYLMQALPAGALVLGELVQREPMLVATVALFLAFAATSPVFGSISARMSCSAP